MAKKQGFRFVSTVPNGPTEGFEDLLPGLRAAVDDDGEVWAWAGLLIDKGAAMLLAASDGEPFVLDAGNTYLRLSWMEANLIADGDTTGVELAKMVRQNVVRAAAH